MQGYITLGFGDQIKHAAGLATSIKANDKSRKVAVLVSKFTDVPTKYENLFDYIVEAPFAVNYEHLDANVWQVYYCTPFDETLYVNPYSIVLSNVSGLWDQTNDRDMLFSLNSLNYRHEHNIKDSVFDIHVQNDLPSLYTDVFYFKKSSIAAEIFKMMDVAFQNWRDVYKTVLKNKKPDTFSQTILINASVAMTGNSIQEISTDIPLYTITDFDGINVDNRSDYDVEWNLILPTWITDNISIKVGNFYQRGIFVYKIPTFLTDELLHDFRTNIKESKNRKTL